MKYIICILIILSLNGCETSAELKPEKLSTLSNDQLCRALGTYNNDGKLILKIYDELGKRTEKVNDEHCYVLEHQEKDRIKNRDTVVQPLHETPAPWYGYPNRNGALNTLSKEYEEIKRIRELNKIHKMLGKPEEPKQQIMKHPSINF